MLMLSLVSEQAIGYSSFNAMPGALSRTVSPAAAATARMVAVAESLSRCVRLLSPSKPPALAARNPHASSSPALPLTPGFAPCGRSTDAELKDTWYAVGFSGDIDGSRPFATRLWGEPVVLYRDRDGEATCVRDVCPHRSAPLSMGDVEDGQLRCFYHGWGFGKQGECESVPTGKAPTGVCVQGYAVAEHENMLFVWRGNPLAADARKLPSMVSATADAAVVDTTLDYDCEWTEVVSRFAGMPHLHWLHESAAPPLASLLPMPLASLPARGSGSSYRTTAERGTVPNIVRHVGASGFEEEVHVVPVGPARCRVLLRQRLPKEGNPVLAMLLQVPGALALLTVLVQNWNFQVAIEDEQQQKQQQATGAAAAAAAEPYFSRWSEKVTSEFGMTSAFGQQQQDSPLAGTYGLKRSYIRDTPQAQYPPLLKSEYAGMVERFQAAQQSLAAGMLATPAAIVTIKTVGPAFAALKDSGLQ